MENANQAANSIPTQHIRICVKGSLLPLIYCYSLKRHKCTGMSDLSFKAPLELQAILGEQIQSLRLSRNLDQRSTAEKAGISKRALRNLEAGRGSTVETLLRTLKALDFLEGIKMLAPEATVSPLALLRHGKVRQRIRQPHGPRKANL